MWPTLLQTRAYRPQITMSRPSHEVSQSLKAAVSNTIFPWELERAQKASACMKRCRWCGGRSPSWTTGWWPWSSRTSRRSRGRWFSQYSALRTFWWRRWFGWTSLSNLWRNNSKVLLGTIQKSGNGMSMCFLNFIWSHFQWLKQDFAHLPLFNSAGLVTFLQLRKFSWLIPFFSILRIPSQQIVIVRVPIYGIHNTNMN